MSLWQVHKAAPKKFYAVEFSDDDSDCLYPLRKLGPVRKYLKAIRIITGVHQHEDNNHN